MAGISDLKMENIRDVRACFYTGGTWTKNQLSRKTGLSLAGTTNVLKYLLEKKEILQSGKAASKAGRKSKQYILNPDSCHIGTVKIMYGRWNHNVEIAAMRLNGECMLSESAGDTLCDSAFLMNMIRILLKEDPLISVLAISLPGTASNGRIETCDVAALEGIDLGAMIDQEFNVPYMIENDVNTACIGFGSDHPDIRNLALIYQPEMSLTGCGIMINGTLYNGCRHAAGEIKHMPLREANDPVSLMQAQIEALCAVLNPEMIGWYSDVIIGDPDFSARLRLPEQLKCETVKLSGFTELIDRGLFAIGMRTLVYL
ncbi:MAG: ROK family protein [Solobacterium sp.]|nr:ROK family protein [Solobacterium sp.]